MEKQLTQLYREFYQEFYERLKSQVDIENRNLSYPLFIHPFEAYQRANKKIMFIGRETYWWWFSKARKFLDTNSHFDNIHGQMISNYKSFALGKDYHNSPFWSVCRKLYTSISSTEPSKSSFIWSNVFRIDENRTTPEKDIINLLLDFKILEEEIKILKPDIVIFFTGWQVDDYLRQWFKDIELTAIEPKLLATAKHPSLTAKVFRTYHPNYLRRSGKENWVIDKITKLVNE